MTHANNAQMIVTFDGQSTSITARQMRKDFWH